MDERDSRDRAGWKPMTRRGALKVGALAVAGTGGCTARGNVESGGGEESVIVDTTGPKADEKLGVDDDCNWTTREGTSDPLVTDYDSRERLGCRGRLFDSFEFPDRWGVYDGSMVVDRTEKFSGEQSVRLEVTEPQRRGWIYRRFEDGIDLRDWDLSLAADPGTGQTKVDNFRLQLLAPDRENRIDMWNPVHGLNGWVRLDFGPTEVVGSPDLSDVRELRIQAWVGRGERGVCHVDQLRLTPKMDRGAVILTFDDISWSQYDRGFKTMQEYGFPGVAGAIPPLVGDDDRISLDGLKEMQGAGWDIVSHPQTEKPLPAFSASKQERLMRQSKQWLYDNGFKEGSNFIIFPMGQAAEETLDAAARFHHMGFLGGRCPTGYVTGPMTVSRVNGDKMGPTRNVLQMAKQYRQVAVVMYHTIGVSEDQISTADFEETLQFIDELGLPVVTASDLWEMNVG
jgi:peptidoglycan/xylan/chitin deacetylase (PgdA/CDA1 family)